MMVIYMHHPYPLDILEKLRNGSFDVKILPPKTLGGNRAFAPWLVGAITVDRNLHLKIMGTLR